MRVTQSSLIALLAGLSFAAPAVAETTIGALGAASPTIEGNASTSARRVLVLGSEVVQDEVISTSANGSGQVVFIDQTTLSIAPNSEVVLDQYVFDPDRSAGEISISLTKGALRFIGGRITKDNAATIETPTATIGIRGGAALIGVDDAGNTTIIHVAGEWTRINSQGEEIDLRRTGGKVTVAKDGPPQASGVATQAELDAFYAQFEGGGGGLQRGLKAEDAIQGADTAFIDYGANERGGAGRLPVATSGASPVIRDVVTFEEGDYQNTIVPQQPEFVEMDRDPVTPPPPPPPPPPPQEPEPFESENLLPGVTGVALVAPTGGFIAPNGAVINNSTAQNVLLTQQTVDPLLRVSEAEIGTESDAGREVDRFSRNGFNAAGERYVIPVDPFTGGSFEYPDGESPRISVPIITGESNLNLDTDFTSAFYDPDTPGARSQVFFGRGTPGQLGAPQGTNGPEQRIYSLRPDPFLGSNTPILPPQVAGVVETPPDIALQIIEEPGQGLFRENGSNGAAKAGFGALTIEGRGTAQSSIFVIGTGRIEPTAENAPSPDVGIYGSVADRSASPDTIEGQATFVAFGDGSTLIGENAENFVLASASRYLLDNDDGYEEAPVRVSSWDGTDIPARGFAHVGDLISQEDQITSERLALGKSYTDAVRDNPGVFISQNDDTAFDGGYVAALGRSFVNGEVSTPYIIHSVGNGVQMAFDSSQNEANAALTFIGGASIIEIDDGEGTFQDGNGVNANPEITSGSFGFGSASTRSLLTNDRDFLLRNKTSEGHNFRTGGTRINGDSGRPAPSVAAEQQAFRGALAPSGSIGDGGSAVFAGTVDTDHEYLRWGYWGGEFRFDADNATGSRFNEREERYHLGTFVAGNRLDEVDLPSADEASFDGFAVVSVSEAGRDYVDGGSFSMTYNFGNRTGDAEFRDLAGYDFDAFVSGDNFTVQRGSESGPADHYAGSIFASGTGTGTGTSSDTGLRPDVSGTVSGSFFTDAAGVDVLATAGRIDFQSEGDDGAALIASGVFGGDGSINEINVD